MAAEARQCYCPLTSHQEERALPGAEPGRGVNGRGGASGIRAQVVQQRSFLESKVWGQMELDGGEAEGAVLVKQIF